MAKSVFQIELAHENPAGSGYFYSYLDLPAEVHEIRDALQKARLTGSDEGYREVNIINSPDFYDLKDVRLDSPTIDELNFLANRLQAMDSMTRTTYEAVIQKVIDKGEPVSMKDLINCTYDLDEVAFCLRNALSTDSHTETNVAASSSEQFPINSRS